MANVTIAGGGGITIGSFNGMISDVFISSVSVAATGSIVGVEGIACCDTFRRMPLALGSMFSSL